MIGPHSVQWKKRGPPCSQPCPCPVLCLPLSLPLFFAHPEPGPASPLAAPLSAEPPSMRLKARPSSPGFSLLTCSAFSFYPPELQLRFLHDGLAAGSGEGDQGPNGDGSFHAWSSLQVPSGEEHHYSCMVQHAGFAQPLKVELESTARSAVPVVGLIIGLLLLLVAATGGALLWRRMRTGLSVPWISLRGDDTGSLLPTPGLPPETDSQDTNGFPDTA
ncbi:IgG receptor FcRn large subunit p51 isoform X1 [Echinops telfairi]|uniref:IgG receptor FcRn large subunit p51 n=1 Tax=Echinops telfairi TaxID=9371 RepID=A0ABM0ZSD5_ECHTE|nr:IgG receptor FcRn large subunit p51 isoform X1 [Echinops telfairi]